MTLSLNGIRACFLIMNLACISSFNGTYPDNVFSDPKTGNINIATGSTGNTNTVNPGNHDTGNPYVTSNPGNHDTGNPFTSNPENGNTGYHESVTKQKKSDDVTTANTDVTSNSPTISQTHLLVTIETLSPVFTSIETFFPVFSTKRKQNKTENYAEDSPDKLKLIDSQFSEGVIPSNAVICIACIALNGHVLLLYKSQLNKVVPTLYFINGIVDILIGSGVALQTFILIPQIASKEEIAGYLSAVSYVIVGVSIRVSTFVNLLLCITRAINILYPFYHVPRAITVRLTCLYSLIWLILAIWDIVWFHLNLGLTSGLYVIKTLLLKPEVGFAAIRTIFKGSLNNVQNVVLLFVPPFLVPLAILIASTIVQVPTIFYSCLQWFDISL